jgi:hypothetical protein
MTFENRLPAFERLGLPFSSVIFPEGKKSKLAEGKMTRVLH